MQRNESLYPPDWLAIAEKDLLRIEWSLRENDPEIAGFFLQQSVEKFLKAFLLSNNWTLRRIHTLSVLLDDAIQYESSLEQYRLACQRIALFYMDSRYPSALLTGVTESDIRHWRSQIVGLIEYIRAALKT
jgi:HEPN domain-containing protein